ncbi:MAG: hypothetical protein LBR27_09970 [Bifidobacteriaceae bacterium]|jgi:uncharacterized protein (DUF608 family)|nr:hypothetical protein [Bifidobacteriaceae bacterium]
MSKSYGRAATQAAFELGGIGTGNVSIGSRGEFRDWELTGRPGVGQLIPYSFFAIRAAAPGNQDQPPQGRILEGDFLPPYPGANGFSGGPLAGLPRFADSHLTVQYPFAQVTLTDPTFPAQVTMEAFTPFIPLDALGSGLPAAVIRYHVANPGQAPLDVSVAGSLGSPIGITGWERFGGPIYIGQPANHAVHDDVLSGVAFGTDIDPEGPQRRHYGTAVLATRPGTGASVTPEWVPSFWADGPVIFWDDFTGDGRLEPHGPEEAGASRLALLDTGTAGTRPGLRVGSVAQQQVINPGETATFEFVLAWHFPNRPRGWEGHAIRQDANGDQTIKNYYATHFADALAVARHVLANLQPLEEQSRAFTQALYGSTLPEPVIETLVAGIATLRSTTCLRLEDGTFVAWEGSLDRDGSCEGTCTHVWNYAQTVAFLFPELEASARRVEFLLETDPDGSMAFRTNRVFGSPRWGMVPAADGQLGCVVRLYREWRNSGDLALVRDCWPAVLRVLGYAARVWDPDGDGVLEGEQHTTYDIEFHGPNSMVGAIYLAALQAAAALAEALGEDAAPFRDLAAASAQRLDAATFNGEYYIQLLDDVDQYDYQYGRGVISDQLFGQFLAWVTGLGDLLPREHIEAALDAVFKYNFRESFRDVAMVQRAYAVADEAGLAMCAWPAGGRPRLPFIYSDEVWTGVEYHVAASLVWTGRLAAAERLVAAVRARYDGVRRSPWNDIECGYHYARSMSGWGLLLAYGGFDYQVAGAALSLAPAVDGPFTSFFTAGPGWGVWSVAADGALRLEVLGGSVALGQVWLRGHRVQPVPDAARSLPLTLAAGESITLT